MRVLCRRCGRLRESRDNSVCECGASPTIAVRFGIVFPFQLLGFLVFTIVFGWLGGAILIGLPTWLILGEGERNVGALIGGVLGAVGLTAWVFFPLLGRIFHDFSDVQ